MKLLFKLHKSPGHIFAYLTDMQKFVAVHPVITKMDRKADNSYLVHETLKMGTVPISFTYPATVQALLLENSVLMRAKVMRLVKIEMMFVLREAGDFTVVEEELLFKAPLPVRLILQRIFKKQHQRLFCNMDMAE